MALFGASLLAHAAGERLTLIQPKKSGLMLVNVNTENDLFAKFSGQVRVGGTFMGVWPEGATNRNYKEPDFLFVPDQESSSLLPHFVLREPPYIKSYRVRSVTVTNGLEALNEAAGAEKVAKLLQRRVNHVRVTGHFVLVDFVVGVECDAPWARAKLLKAELPEQVAIKHTFALAGC
ncbi:hypothetical protein [Rubrivivax gelatinosus]|uniref:hypothetical protein n=1 Tax=Rubrivivax gelatinosus TaxID=28068 RepID=UPI001902C402|nr:hypothetical protein [Rubrivivax gelatinosus]